MVVRVAGLEPAWAHHPRDFKSLASTISPNPRMEDSTTIRGGKEPLKRKNAQLIARLLPHSFQQRNGPPREARTHDPLIKSQVLYH